MFFVDVRVEVSDFILVHFGMYLIYPILCGVCYVDVNVVVDLSRVVPLVANWSAISFPMIPMCALLFDIVILWVDHTIWLNLAQMTSLFRWLC